ncbi:MAG: class I SAM-dependent methyltransferase [Chitinophagales bacterium]
MIRKHLRKLKEALLRSSFKQDNVEDTFQKIFNSNFWGSKESISGVGSNLEQTETLIIELSKLLQSREDINSVLDLPCGDFNWMQKVDLTGINYIGADIVKPLIENNLKSFEKEGRTFRHLNLISDELPKVDLVIVRDCLVHLSEENIALAISNLKRSGSKYLLSTSFVDRKQNKNIKNGDWRPINLELTPFNFPKPELSILENCTEARGKYKDKTMGLWKISDL